MFNTNFNHNLLRKVSEINEEQRLQIIIYNKKEPNQELGSFLLH